jgi:hypothetical protein
MSISGPLTVSELNATLFGTSEARAVPTDDIIKAMLDVGTGISDLIFSPGRPPQVERYGELVEVKVAGLPALRNEDTAGIASDLIRNNEVVLRTLKESGSTDLSYVLPERCRFRVNIFRQRGTFAIVMRHRARDRPDRVRQVVHARGDHRPDQRIARRAHPHHRGPDRVPAFAQEGHRASA